MSTSETSTKKSVAPPVDNPNTVKPEIAVYAAFGFSIPPQLCRTLIKNDGPDMFEATSLDGYPVLQDYRMSRNNCKDKRVYVVFAPVLEPWRLRDKPKHDSGFFSPAMWPTEVHQKALETVLRKNFLWTKDVEETFGLHVIVREGRN